MDKLLGANDVFRDLPSIWAPTLVGAQLLDMDAISGAKHFRGMETISGTNKFFGHPT